jgi:hypothetical protein
MDLGNALKDAGSLLGNLGIVSDQQGSINPPQAVNSGYNQQPASVFTGGAGPSPAPSSQVPTWAYVGGGVVLLVVLVLVLKG